MKKPYTTILSLVGMFLVIGVAYTLDVCMDNLKRIAMSEFTIFSSWLLPVTILELLFAGLLLAWLWFVNSKDDDHLIIPLIFVAVGLSLLFYNYLVSLSSLPLPMLLALIPKSLSSFASALVAVVGLQRLVFRKTKTLS